MLAELDVYHSRPIAPTRRVALGAARLPADPAPGFGGILLGGIVAAHISGVDPDLRADLLRLTIELEDGQQVAQPRLRYRYQTDRVGLIRSRFRLLGEDGSVTFDLDLRGTPAQAVLGAVYAAGRYDVPTRFVVMSAIRRAMRWVGPIGPRLVADLAGGVGHEAVPFAAFADPTAWALSTLGLGPDRQAVQADVQRRFRSLLREAHPDHGGAVDGAARRIAELTEARRILLGR